MEFSELKLHPDLQRGISEAGYTSCMPVQEQVLGHAFGGQDMYVQSQTGTGKTAAFLIVIFQRLLSEALLTGKKAIIMVPTRELAVQVEEEAKLLGKYLPFKIGSFYGGVGYTQQTKMLRENVQILVGTPGRVLDLNQSGQMNLMDIAFLVIDEADRMFDMGFYPDLRKLIQVVPSADKRQTMLFSATLNAWVKNLAWEYTKTPFEIEIAPETVTVEAVEQLLYHVPSADKMRLLLGILEREQPESAIIFCNTKRYTEIAAKRLTMNGYEAEFIIGDLPQVKRLKVIEDIKKGKLRFLVATDVAARGLDIEGLALVVNYDLPNEAENYVHRIGRTARAGKTGKAITLASEQDVYELPAIERYIGQKIPSETAVEELYGEDKSEGARIRADFASGNGGGKERGRRGEKTGGKDRERDRQREKRPENRSRPRSEKAENAARDKSEGGKKSSGFRNRGERPNLSALSFEERMAYYKTKYSGDAPPADGFYPRASPKPSGEGGKTGGKNRNGKARRSRHQGEGNQKIPGESLERQSPRKKNGPDTAAPANVPLAESKTALAETPQKSSGKTGILSRLAGLFRKKNPDKKD